MKTAKELTADTDKVKQFKRKLAEMFCRQCPKLKPEEVRVELPGTGPDAGKIVLYFVEGKQVGVSWLCQNRLTGQKQHRYWITANVWD